MKKGAEAIQSLVLGNCGLGSLPKGTMWHQTHGPSTTSPTSYRCTTTHHIHLAILVAQPAIEPQTFAQVSLHV